jgi:uncharacterized protein (TIGR00369 family)
MHNTPLEITDELHTAITGYFDRVPFNHLLGLQVEELSAEKVSMRMPMKNDLIGNYIHGILHGGAIATVLDVVGGAMAMIGALGRHQHLPLTERMSKLSRLGTIDLRVDYLRPGRGESFLATAVLLRSGNKVAVVRAELHANDGTLIAVGTGTYLCG